MVVRTRFAPSPTGSLHVGSVRTALFSWLYARHHGGQFVLRIEDTDSERSTKESVDAILKGMEWLGLDADEGPIFQTARYERYRDVAKHLLETGQAYRCTCSKERLLELREKQLQEKQKPRYDGHCRNLNLDESAGAHVLRFKHPEEGSVLFQDLVYGEIKVSNEELDDLVLIRTDGHPTYNFAVVIDDWDMKITHVIRGDDHISNTPRQIHLFNALNAPIPVFAHLPMILGQDGKRLSKRHGAVNVLEFRETGILPHALLNYLVRLGWSSGDQEIFSLEEMVQAFDLKNVSRGVSGFNHEKLYWLNQHYIKSDPVKDVADVFSEHLKRAGFHLNEGPNPEAIVKAFADRVKTLQEMCEKSRCFYEDDVVYDEAAFSKFCNKAAISPLEHLYKRLLEETTWERERLQHHINETCVALDIGMGKVGMPLRVAVTGSPMSPALDVTLELIGKKRTLSRLSLCLARISA